MMAITLLVATHNAGKVAEYADMLGTLDVQWVSLHDVGCAVEVEENGRSFSENAVLKARGYAAETGLLTLADDSGLEVDALDGAPGIHTARYGGAGLTHAQRYEKLLEAMREVPPEERGARFRCVIALAAPDGRVLGITEGSCEGMITPAAAGEGGFGYDPVFLVTAQGRTMAELPPAVKHEISHRGEALRAIEPLLLEVLDGSRT
jgi:XTP/dITP diphosphohydrolase